MEAERLYYSFDLVPAFWKWLSSTFLAGDVASIAAVRNEITAGTGDLVDWARKLPGEFWFSDSEWSIQSLTRLAEWVNDPARNYTQEAVAEFLGSADARLIAQAHASNSIVATREKSNLRSRKRVKMPDACSAFGVACVTPFDAYRRLGMCLH